VWKILRAVKTEFGKFGEVLTKVKRQLDRASLTIEDTGVRTRAITRTLRSVEQLPDEEATRILELPAAETEVEPDEPDVEKVYLFGNAASRTRP
jgi:DNA recombination protein RmuC